LIALSSRLADLDVQIEQRGNVLTVEQRATPPAIPVDPDPVRYVLVGVAGGLLAGLLAALVAERLRRRIEHSSELAEAAGTDVVLDLSSGGAANRTAPYRFLARVGRNGPAGRPGALLLVASTEHDRVDDVGMELAQVVAAGHERVLLLPALGAPALVVEDGGGHAAADRSEDVDMAIHCSLPPTRDPALDRLTPALDRAVVVATSGGTTFAEAHRVANMLRAVGVEVAAALLLPHEMRGPDAPHERQTRDERARSVEVAAE
jgi:hypothetical protein